MRTVDFGGDSLLLLLSYMLSWLELESGYIRVRAVRIQAPVPFDQWKAQIDYERLPNE